MSYEDIKERSEQLRENNDCSVRALAAALGDDSTAYDLAHDHMKAHGRAKGRGMRMSVIKKAFRSAGFELERVTSQYLKAKTTLTAERYLPTTGTFLLVTSRHIAAYKDGELFDWSSGRRLRIEQILKVI